MDFEKCTESSKNKIIAVTENNRKLIINNPSARQVDKIKVDGCLIKDGIRCDYLFEIDKPCSKAIYLELKGCDIKKAYEQLDATLSKLKDRHKNIDKECYIIASRIPKAGTQVQQLKVSLLKNQSAKLSFKTNQASIDLSAP